MSTTTTASQSEKKHERINLWGIVAPIGAIIVILLVAAIAYKLLFSKDASGRDNVDRSRDALAASIDGGRAGGEVESESDRLRSEVAALKQQLLADQAKSDKQFIRLSGGSSGASDSASSPAENPPDTGERFESYQITLEDLKQMDRKEVGVGPKHVRSNKPVTFKVADRTDQMVTRRGVIRARPVLTPEGHPLLDSGTVPKLGNYGGQPVRVEVHTPSGWKTFWFVDVQAAPPPPRARNNVPQNSFRQ